MKITWDFLKENGFSSVTDYCRFLMESGTVNGKERIEVYRDEMLCFTVSSVEFGAKYEPSSKGGFRKYSRKAQEPRTSI